jgi:hypothetical protein
MDFLDIGTQIYIGIKIMKKNYFINLKYQNKAYKIIKEL